ncbi:hypothetical protein F4814DRAFT_450409 [Daldinia grandis]|nr:hypothetical protein F4814DRAFT_450409 [Daldinia grandis]
MADNTSVDCDSNLAALNSATLGAEMPQITLPDRIYSALLINIRAYNEAHKVDKNKKTQLQESMRATLPLLEKVGMFDLFTAEEWISGNNEGRKVVGKMYQEFKSRQ